MAFSSSEFEAVGAELLDGADVLTLARMVSTCTRSSFDNMRAFDTKRRFLFCEFLNAVATRLRFSRNVFC